MSSGKKDARGTGNLPFEMDSFVGRGRELKELRRTLASARLVTLTGVGGVGKTRLALRLARELDRAFSDGVWLARLADLPRAATRALVEQTVAEAFGLSDFSAGRPRDVLVEHIRGKQCLLVVDNCEHLVDEVGPLLAELLRMCAKLRILATSRQALGCVGEYVFQVSPLRVPPDSKSMVGVSAEALELLRQRAAAVGNPVAAGNVAVAAELCRRLDGLPLAIELAASRMNVLSIEEVLERSGDRFGLLTGGARHAWSTHDALRSVMDWSYHLCNHKEKLLWERLAVFTGGFDLPALEDVCSGDGLESHETIDVLGGLARQSLVVVENAATRSRYRVLESVREYGLGRLIDRGEEAAVRARHRDYYVRLALESADDCFSCRETRWLEWARTEMPNLREAMNFDLQQGDGTVALRIAVALTCLRIWFFAGWLTEGKTWLKKAIDAAHKAEKLLRVTATALHGWISLWQGEPQAAAESLSRCRVDAESVGFVPAVEFLEAGYAFVVEQSTRSVTMLAELRAKLQAAGAGSSETALIELTWAIAATFLEDRDTAFRASQELLDSVTHADAARSASFAHLAVGLAHVRHGNPQDALPPLRESIRRSQELGDQWAAVWGVHAFAWALAADLGRAERVDVVVAEQIAQALGGAQRLRDGVDVRLMGLGPHNEATTEAECVARSVLGDHAYLLSFEKGRYAMMDSAEACHNIMTMLLGEQAPKMAPGSEIERPEELPAERLTKREYEIVALVAKGLSNPEIARELTISDRTVQTHVSNVLNKSGLRNRQEIAVWFSQGNTMPSVSYAQGDRRRTSSFSLVDGETGLR